MAERIGNLLGQLKFSDDQLKQTQKGLDSSGIQLPNFGNVGKELAKEINEEEVEVEMLLLMKALPIDQLQWALEEELCRSTTVEKPMF